MYNTLQEGTSMRNELIKCKRIVIKVGTSTLTYPSGKINFKRMSKLAEVLADLTNQGKEIVLVSSGAIGVGVGKLKLTSRPSSVQEKQAIAAVGQVELMHLYSKFFGEYGYVVAQILLTKDVIEHKTRKNNAKNTFSSLLSKSIIPIVNENDTVATDEIEFGDNDTLSAMVSVLIDADLLIILSDIDGFYDADPSSNQDAKLVSSILEVNPAIEKMAGGVTSNRGTGGMITKLNAAKIVNKVHIPLLLINGSKPEIIYNALQGENIGSLFGKTNHE